MKTYSILCMAALALAAPAFAEDAHHVDEATAVPVAAAQNPEANLQQMQGNVKKMQTQLDRLSRTKDSEQRQKLLGEHMQTMRESMMLGHEMAGGGMAMAGAGMPMDGACMMGGQGMAMLHEATLDRLQQMERRMDMMQTVLDQVLAPAAAMSGASKGESLQTPGGTVR